ncbi:MAG: zinc metallopeptidase [Planctomycetes bacterium]|nr:zinc metallopeptidase [Planctomycetota bacterium]
MLFGPWMLLLIPGLLFGLYAQAKVKGSFRKYSKVPSSNKISGASAARRILDAQGLSDVNVEEVPGTLTDHYDPRTRVLRLSQTVYQGHSLAALGVAAHEAGHAVQHARKYIPIMLRTGIFPIVGLGSQVWFWIFLAGMFFHHPLLVNIGIFLFAGVVLFQIITLPVEFNASSRAMVLLTQQGIIMDSEIDSTKSVLNAAALTYLAATLMAILQLVSMLFMRNR